MATDTTNATMTGSAEQPQVPRWVGVMIAVVIVGSMAGGAGLWAWSYYNQPNQKDLTEVTVGTSTALRMTSPNVTVTPQAKALTPGVMQRSPTSYYVLAGDFSLTVLKSGAAADWTTVLQYQKAGILTILTADERGARLAQRRLTTDPAFAKSLKVSDEQIAKLMQLPPFNNPSPVLQLTPAEQTRIKTMWTQYVAAPKADAGTAMIAAIQEIAKPKLEALRSSLADPAKQIQQILTPEQIAPFKG
jgi:hypothetical protein